ncbi:STAS domain-containing protein [Streptosporangium sandarakinum]|uniref:STAS domain-containing protein n=1 Tax=Streptosporangium sandarakinum TaxID=1260955 RepID=UPI0034240FB7
MGIRLDRQTDREGARVLIPIGDLDRDAVEPLSAAVGEELAGRPARLVIRMTHVPFCDSSGIVMLLDAHADATGRGTWLALADVGDHLRGLFRLSALDRVVPIIEEPPHGR